jgi:hypothetical protein
MESCHYCGAELQADARFCPQCGKALEQSQDYVAPKLPRRNWLFIIGVTILLFVVVGRYLPSGPSSESSPPPQPSDPLRGAREQFVKQNNDIVQMTARAEGYRPGYEGNLGGRCELNGEDGTTLICSPYSDGSRASVGNKPGDWHPDDLCGRGFKEVLIGSTDQKLNCAGISPYHKAINQYGVEVWTH